MILIMIFEDMDNLLNENTKTQDHVKKQIEELEDLVDEKEENIEFNWLYNNDHSESPSTTNDDLFSVNLVNVHEDSLY
jgi:hypothetical protein